MKLLLRLSLILALALPALAQVADDLSPDEYLEIIKNSAIKDDALRAQEKLVKVAPKGKKGKEFTAKVWALYDLGKNKSRPYVQAAAGGVLLVLDPNPVAPDAVGRLLNGDDDQRLRWLNVADEIEPIDAIYEKFPEILPKCGGKAKAKAQKVYDAWSAAKQGSGLGTFFGLIVMVLIAGVGYVAKLASSVDPMKLLLVKYIEEAPEREKIIRDLKTREAGDPEQKIEAEGPIAPKIVPYLDKFYTPAEVATILELLSHWDVPAVHENLRLYSTARFDLVKTAAIAGMSRMQGDQWTQELVKLLEDGDEIQSAAAARSLAERQATEEIPRIQRLYENAGGSLREAYKDALERLAPRG